MTNEEAIKILETLIKIGDPEVNPVAYSFKYSDDEVVRALQMGINALESESKSN